MPGERPVGRREGHGIRPTLAYSKMVLHTQASLGIGQQNTARFWQDLKPTDLHWTLSEGYG